VRITLLSAMFGVGSAFAIVLSVGFRYRQSFDALGDGQFGTLAALALVGIAFALTLAASFLQFKAMRWMGIDVSHWRTRGGRAQRRVFGEKQTPGLAKYQLTKKLRAAALASDPDPRRRKYAPLVERGQRWNDEQIEYAENVRLTGTCVHLQSIERAIREAGIATSLVSEFWRPNLATTPLVCASCQLNLAELRRRFGVAESVKYEEGFRPDRTAEDNPWATLTCGECRSSIEFIHPKEAPAGTPWFPSASRV
jgi:hypothetical protein